MHELLLISSLIGFNIVLYFRTIFFTIVVDDIRQYSRIQASPHWGKFSFKNILGFLSSRLYSGGTFSFIKDCWTCKGKLIVEAFDNNTQDKKIQNVTCPTCHGTGRARSINTRLDHAFTLFLHATICVLIYFALGHNKISFFAAMLYSCNPANNQTAIWLNGRRYAVNIILTLLAALTSPFGILLLLFTPLFQFTAFFSPVLFGWWGCALIPVALFLGRDRIIHFYKVRMKSIVNPDMTTFHKGRVIVTIKTFGFYIRKMLFPGRTFMCYPFLANWGLTKEGNNEAYRLDSNFYVGIGALSACLAGLFILKGNYFFYLLFMTLATLQWCNIQTATQTAADRYISLPNVFMMFFVSAFCFTYLGSYALVAIAALGAYYVTTLQTTMLMYQDINTYYDYHNYFDPKNTITRKFKINWMLKTGDVLGAWDLIRTGLVLNPTDFSMNYQAAVATMLMGDTKMSNFYLDNCDKNHYINQESLWTKSIQEIREKNKQASQPFKRQAGMSPTDFAKGIK